MGREKGGRRQGLRRARAGDGDGGDSREPRERARASVSTLCQRDDRGVGGGGGVEGDVHDRDVRSERARVRSLDGHRGDVPLRRAKSVRARDGRAASVQSPVRDAE